MKNNTVSDVSAGEYRPVHINGAYADTNPVRAYRGLGAITGNNSSRLLLDYKEKNPSRYREIMELLFKPGCGAGLTHVKIEFGADVNSSSGTEPSTMRSEQETADVSRGAGFIFAADALKINPDITVDLLRWGEPKWVTDAFEKGRESGFEARYKWYKETVDAAYDKYGIKFYCISADGNEPSEVDTDWIIYFSRRLKSETKGRYDYSKIKIAASDEVESWKIADAMMENAELRDAVDIAAEHYNTWASPEALILNNEYGKELWYSEGIASTNIARLSVTSNGSGLCGVNGCLDVCNRIINGYCNGGMTLYEYQPAVAAYYSGSKYFPKSLIIANEPWCGYYEADAGLWTSAHFTMFAEKGWQYITGACYGDGKENHSITETTHNYLTLADPKTGDYSVIICNDSDRERRYAFTVSNLAKAGSSVCIYETVGPESRNDAYNANYLRLAGTVTPVPEQDGTYSYRAEVKPYSIVTITTLKKDNIPVPCKMTCPAGSEVLPLPYCDSFDYGERFIPERGGTPLYTTDQGGAFEAVRQDRGDCLMQMITYDSKPTDWHYRETPPPITSLGDDRWSDYSAGISFELSRKGGADNYVGLGIRYISAETNEKTCESGYALRVFQSGRWELRKNSEIMSQGIAHDFDASKRHCIKITADGCLITAELDGQSVAHAADTVGFNNSGRVSISSGYYNNSFYDLKVLPLGDKPYHVTRTDDHDPLISYCGRWENTVPVGFAEFNRTTSAAVPDPHNPPCFSFSFTGTEFALIGPSDSGELEAEIDGVKLTEAMTAAGSRQVFFKKTGLKNGRHNVTVAPLKGKLVLDAIETK